LSQITLPPQTLNERVRANPKSRYDPRSLWFVYNKNTWEKLYRHFWFLYTVMAEKEPTAEGKGSEIKQELDVKFFFEYTIIISLLTIFLVAF
jgi:hypothetical protein